MCCNSFEMQDMREIGSDEAVQSRLFFHLVQRNNRFRLPNRRKGMQRPGKIERVKEKM